MPLVLEPADFDIWLDNRTDVAKVQPLLRPLADDELEAVAVSPLVNSPRNDGPELLEPASPEPA
jgi:putative SOS response-associated peptidase YedK